MIQMIFNLTDIFYSFFICSKTFLVQEFFFFWSRNFYSRSTIFFILVVCILEHSHKKWKDKKTQAELAVLRTYVENQPILAHSALPGMKM